MIIVEIRFVLFVEFGSRLTGADRQEFHSGFPACKSIPSIGLDDDCIVRPESRKVVVELASALQDDEHLAVIVFVRRDTKASRQQRPVHEEASLTLHQFFRLAPVFLACSTRALGGTVPGAPVASGLSQSISL